MIEQEQTEGTEMKDLRIQSLFVSSVASLERRPPARNDRTRSSKRFEKVERRAAGPEAGAPIARCFVAVLLVFLLWAGRAEAHDPGLSTATLQWTPERLEVTLAFSLIDAGQIAGPDGKFSRPGLAARALTVKFDDQPAQPVQAQWRFDDNHNAIVSLEFNHGSSSKLFVQSCWLGDLPPGHRQLLSLKNAGGEVITEQWLSAGSDSATIQIADVRSKPEPGTATYSFLNFLALGVKHIWTGYDHLLFLFGL